MISENAKYWLRLSKALGFCNKKIKALYEMYSDISVFFEGGENEWRFCGIFSDRDLDHLKNIGRETSDSIISRCEELGYSIISIDDSLYPQCLREISDPPAVIYVWGNLPDVDNLDSVGIVGTRTASNYGLKNSYSFGYALSRYGIVVISGGALGVDCASHRGALAANGVTICVRGCGINYPYLMDNAAMREAITNKGAVISEYPPDTPPMPYQFPERNRIIAALSDGLLIIESGKKSGSLITAGYALQMGRQLFALLGNNSPQNEGSNARIKEGTAVPVTDFMDILVAFDNRYYDTEVRDIDNISLADIEAIPVKGGKPSKTLPEKTRQAEPEPAPEPVHKRDLKLKGDLKKVYEDLSAEPVHIDAIAARLMLPVFRVSVALTQLQIMGLVGVEPGRKFFLK